MKHPVELENGMIVCYGGPPGAEHPTTDLFSNLFIADPKTGRARQLTHTEGDFAYKHPAPMNGKIVAHKEDKSKSGEADLVLLDPSTGEESPLTTTPGADERHPFYNEKVDLLVYHRKENGDKNLVLSTPDGSRTAQLTFYGRPAQSQCWSKDGGEIFFVKKGPKPPEGQPFFARQAEIRAIDVKDALKDLRDQARRRLESLEKAGADREQVDAAFQDLESYRYFLRRYQS
jgi:Tol biopolymer transport system component